MTKRDSPNDSPHDTFLAKENSSTQSSTAKKEFRTEIQKLEVVLALFSIQSQSPKLSQQEIAATLGTTSSQLSKFKRELKENFPTEKLFRNGGIETSSEAIEVFENLNGWVKTYRGFKKASPLPTLRIGTGNTFANAFLPIVIREFRKEFSKSQIKLSLDSGGPAYLKKKIRAQELDVAFLEIESDWNGVDSNGTLNHLPSNTTKTFRLPQAIITPRGHQLGLCKTEFPFDELKNSDEDLVLVVLRDDRDPKPNIPHELINSLSTSVTVQEVGSQNLLHAFVISGEAIGITIPQFLSEHQKASLDIVFDPAIGRSDRVFAIFEPAKVDGAVPTTLKQRAGKHFIDILNRTIETAMERPTQEPSDYRI